MAWVEYQDPNRPIQNQATYQKIQDYSDRGFSKLDLEQLFCVMEETGWQKYR